MSWWRDPPSSPESEPLSVMLLRAIGVLEELTGREPVSEQDTLAAESEIAILELWPLIEAGVRTAGYDLPEGHGTLVEILGSLSDAS